MLSLQNVGFHPAIRAAVLPSQNGMATGLPRPGESEPGKLILNPAAVETADYVVFRVFDRHRGSAN